MAIDSALGRLGIKQGVCTSSTRPTNPFEGQVIYESDTNLTLVYDNAAWVVIANASSTGFPTSLDTNTVDSIAALQAKVGSDSSAVTTSLDYLVRSACPVGSVMPFAGSSSPDATWLVCDGSAISRTTYATLFAVLGTTYGSGDGSTTFNIPNMQGRVPVGYDSGQTEFDALGETGGAKTHTLTSGESAHSHSNSLTGTTSFASTSHTHAHVNPIGLVSGSLNVFSPSDADMDAYGSTSTFESIQSSSKRSIGTPSTGNVERWRIISSGPSATSSVGISNANNTAANASSAHNNLQPYIALNYIMKAA